MRLTSEILKINRQKLLNAFPADLKNDVEVVCDFLVDQNFDIHPTHEQKIVFKGQNLVIPGRVYFDEPTKTTGQNLTIRQQTILNCMYLRHKNGFVRQKSLEKLLGRSDSFLVPFIFQLLGEYVLEILLFADKHINEHTIADYLNFFEENPKYRQQTESRMISYWDAYYRRQGYKRLNDYIGYQIFKRIKTEEQKRTSNIGLEIRRD